MAKKEIGEEAKHGCHSSEEDDRAQSDEDKQNNHVNRWAGWRFRLTRRVSRQVKDRSYIITDRMHSLK